VILYIFQKSCIGISVPMQDMFLFKAMQETYEQQKSKIDVDEFITRTTNITLYHYLVKSYRFTLIKFDKLVCLKKTFPAILTLPWFAIFLAHMCVSLTKQQGRTAHNTQQACTTHNVKGELSGLCYGCKEACAICAISIFTAPYFFIL
jgi:hypothetical protein